MKLLFLDIDGVLNSDQSSHFYWRTMHGRKCFMNGFAELCPIACSNLNFLLERCPELSVVISSTWRIFHDLPELEKGLSEKVPSIVGRIIGRTPRLIHSRRGEEIHHWLTANGHLDKKFVVIDDDTDMDKVKSEFIHIDGFVGFTWRDLLECARRLGVELWDRS